MATEYDAALRPDVSEHFKGAVERVAAAVGEALDETNERVPRTPYTLRERAHYLFRRRWPRETQERHFAENKERADVFMAAMHRARKRISP